MSTPHVEALKEKHAELDALLHEEQVRPAPDPRILQLLKKQKLALKEEVQGEMARA